MRHPRSDIEEIFATVAHIRFPVIDLSLDRIKALLERLGHPEKRLPPVIHVAGTNGKGSLLAYLRAIFEAAGYKVHRYISPHLVKFNERVMLAGRDIDDDHLYALLKRVAAECAGTHVTYFEATTALAYLAFAEVKADILLLETGLGGRLDATNVLNAPMLTAITPVSMDHTDYLGTTLAAIAGEKAGILKPSVMCVTGPQEAAALNVIERRANQINTPLFRHNQQWKVQQEANGFRYISQTKDAFYPLPSLAGAHQIDNAATAIACIENIHGFTISEAHIAHGITHAEWPARLQHLASGALADLLPKDGSELWLDGGHNESAGRELAAWMARQQKPIHVICGMLNSKDSEAFLAPMQPYVQSLVGIPIEGDNMSRTADEISVASRNSGIPATLKNNIKSAIEHIVKNNNNVIILICGSLSLAGNTLWQNSTDR